MVFNSLFFLRLELFPLFWLLLVPLPFLRSFLMVGLRQILRGRKKEFEEMVAVLHNNYTKEEQSY